jgi:hypothetical protein
MWSVTNYFNSEKHAYIMRGMHGPYRNMYVEGAETGPEGVVHNRHAPTSWHPFSL